MFKLCQHLVCFSFISVIQPGSGATNAAAEVVALHTNLVSDRALSIDVHSFLHRNILSSWQDEKASTKGNTLCFLKPSIQA